MGGGGEFCEWLDTSLPGVVFVVRVDLLTDCQRMLLVWCICCMVCSNCNVHTSVHVAGFSRHN